MPGPSHKARQLAWRYGCGETRSNCFVPFVLHLSWYCWVDPIPIIPNFLNANAFFIYWCIYTIICQRVATMQLVYFSKRNLRLRSSSSRKLLSRMTSRTSESTLGAQFWLNLQRLTPRNQILNCAFLKPFLFTVSFLVDTNVHFGISFIYYICTMYVCACIAYCAAICCFLKEKCLHFRYILNSLGDIFAEGLPPEPLLLSHPHDCGGGCTSWRISLAEAVRFSKDHGHQQRLGKHHVWFSQHFWCESCAWNVLDTVPKDLSSVHALWPGGCRELQPLSVCTTLHPWWRRYHSEKRRSTHCILPIPIGVWNVQTPSRDEFESRKDGGEWATPQLCEEWNADPNGLCYLPKGHGFQTLPSFVRFGFTVVFVCEFYHACI